MTVAEIINAGILIATIVAIIYGPIIAVKINRQLDIEREIAARKSQVFRDLMKTRQLILDPVRVSALNMVVVEFYKNPEIIEKYKLYINHLNLDPNSSGPNNVKQFFSNQDDLFSDLLGEIAKQQGYNFDKRDLARFGYSPVGWQDAQLLQQKNAQLLSEVLEGKRALPVGNLATAQSPYPPAPSIE